MINMGIIGIKELHNLLGKSLILIKGFITAASYSIILWGLA